MSGPRVVTIDGPAASGKSTTAAAVAKPLGLVHVDSGSVYRAITWLALRDGLDSARAIVATADAAHLALEPVPGALVLRVGGRDVEAEIRSAAVTGRVSAISAIGEVRDWVNQRLRGAVAVAGGAVMDGRDIGTVVFPEAILKVFLTATAESRARRRLVQQGGVVDPEELARATARLEARDRLDSTRAVAPLRPAQDAIEVDTTHLRFDEQVAQILALAQSRGLLPA